MKKLSLMLMTVLAFGLASCDKSKDDVAKSKASEAADKTEEALKAAAEAAKAAGANAFDKSKEAFEKAKIDAEREINKAAASVENKTKPVAVPLVIPDEKAAPSAPPPGPAAVPATPQK